MGISPNRSARRNSTRSWRVMWRGVQRRPKPRKLPDNANEATQMNAGVLGLTLRAKSGDTECWIPDREDGLCYSLTVDDDPKKRQPDETFPARNSNLRHRRRAYRCPRNILAVRSGNGPPSERQAGYLRRSAQMEEQTWAQR